MSRSVHFPPGQGFGKLTCGAYAGRPFGVPDNDFGFTSIGAASRTLAASVSRHTVLRPSGAESS